MKALISILIIVAVIYGVRELVDMYKRTEAKASGQVDEPPPPVSADVLPGLLPSLEGTLQEAQKQGADGLRDFLRKYRAYVRDPRLAAIELDYVVMVSRKDPREARRVFQGVKARVPPSSPVYERVKSLEKTYQ